MAVCADECARWGLTLTPRQTREVAPLPTSPLATARCQAVDFSSGTPCCRTEAPAGSSPLDGSPSSHQWAWCEGVPPAGTLQSASHADQVHLFSPSLQIGPPIDRHRPQPALTGAIWHHRVDHHVLRLMPSSAYIYLTKTHSYFDYVPPAVCAV